MGAQRGTQRGTQLGYGLGYCEEGVVWVVWDV